MRWSDGYRKTPAARTAVKGARSLRVHRSVPGFPHKRSLLVWDGVAQTLDGCRSEGYAREARREACSASILFLNKFATRNLRYLVRDRICVNSTPSCSSQRGTSVPRQLPKRGGVSPYSRRRRRRCSSGRWSRTRRDHHHAPHRGIPLHPAPGSAPLCFRIRDGLRSGEPCNGSTENPGPRHSKNRSSR